MLQYIDADCFGTRYYTLDYTSGSGLTFPWGEDLFDCHLFPPTKKDSTAMASLLSSLPYEQIDWVHTSEPHAEYWHDEVDRASVARGTQQRVGDGKPMTAWFSDLHDLADWERSKNLGSSPHFLFVFVQPSLPLHHRKDLLRRRIKST